MGERLVRLIKLLLSIALIGVIYKYFLKIENFGQVWLEIVKLPWNIYLLAVAVCLINWGIEARKWQVLLKQLEKLSFSVAFKSTFSGITVSNILPFRVGEYFGRIIYLAPENRIPAAFNSVFGSTMQLVISLIFGIPAAISIFGNAYQNMYTLAAITLVGIFLFFVILFFYSRKIKNAPKKWLNRLFDDIRKFTFFQIGITLWFSFLRYAVFSSFYVFLLWQFSIIQSVETGYLSVATIYFLQSFAPGMIVTDVGMRTGIPLLVIPVTSPMQPSLIAAALVNYFFNLLLPSLFGLYFIIVQKIRNR